MAQAPNRPCLQCRVNLTKETYCKICKPIVESRKKKENQEYEKKRGSSSQRGYDKVWRKISKDYLKKHRICVYCGNPAECVDHIIAHKGNETLFKDSKNWAASCIKCNSSKCAREEGGFGNERKL
ncbi:MAG: HNH endonuclease [archaeon]|nr:HNH endonuclease [archaeon]